MKTDVAQFINQADLNLTRDHHTIVYSHDYAAACVCNHKGSAPTAADPTGLFPPPSEVDALLKDIKTVPTTNAIACVAMEFSTRGKRGAAASATPFTKFYIFGPDDALWSTIDLDGRGPKGVPNVCTACHGGPFDYEDAFGAFSSNIAPKRNGKDVYPGDLGAHFLPFDMGNFAFASTVTGDQREEQIFRMNRDVFEIERNRWTVGADGYLDYGYSSLAIYNLIAGWYNEAALFTPPAVTPYFNTTYVPINWDTPHGNRHNAYLYMFTRSCRTCHVAMDRANAEYNSNVFSTLTTQILACTQPTSLADTNRHVMPNAKVTFDRFWLSSDIRAPVPPGSLTGQPDYLGDLIPNSILNQTAPEQAAVACAPPSP